MRVTHLGHACLLVEMADSRVLVDPGTFSAGFEDLRDLDAVVITHQHADHVDWERVPALLAANRQAPLFADPETAAIVAEGSTEISSDVIVTAAGDETSVSRVTLSSVGRMHAVIHAGVPRITNVGVVLRADGEPSLYHPGDAYDGEPGAVDVLGVPLSAPWCKVSETIDFVTRIAPTRLVPIHDALLAPTGRRMYLDHVSRFGAGGQVVVHDPTAGVAEDISLD